MKQVISIILILVTFLPACRKEPDVSSVLETPDWTEETHSNNVDADYSVVFPEGAVLRFDITISSADWTRMQVNLNVNIMRPSSGSWTPVWVPCSFRFNGKEWYKVGIRYKGNSSLKECFRRNIRKYSLKLDFDEFEGDYPKINDQRFFGFKQLNLSNGFDDPGLMREKTASDLFREFGIPAARTAFCEVWIDYGEGSKYFGLYTLVEEVDDTVLDTQFEGGGNLYKPEGPVATFAAGTYNILQLDKKTNLETVDYSDIRALYDIINSPLRTTAHDTWKADLENILDVPHFLKWLAANTVIQNWDTYGKMFHNYYLYNNPATGRLTWIPWDNNESLRAGKAGGALTLSFTEVSDKWPLIRYLADDATYFAMYKDYVASFVSDPFDVDSFQQRIESQAKLIRQYAVAEVQGYTFLGTPVSLAFDQAIADLKLHVESRNNAVDSFLGK